MLAPRQNDRCDAKAQHMLYEGLGLARTLWRTVGARVCVPGDAIAEFRP